MIADAAYLRWSVFKQLPTAVAVAVLVFAAICAALWLLPQMHKAKALLLVEGQSVSTGAGVSKDALADAAHLQNIENRLMTQSRMASFLQSQAIDMDPDKLRNAVNFDLVSGRGKATTLTINVRNIDADIAVSTANRLAELVIAEDRQIRTERAETALKFFRHEVTESKSKLDARLADLLAFKSANAGKMPSDLPELLNRKNALTLLASPSPQTAKPPAQLRQLRADLQAARAVYSDRHPKVQLLLTELRARQQPPQTNAGPDLSVNDQLAKIKAELAAIPANELTLNALMRDHDLAEAHYKTAISRLEAAAIEERIALRENGDGLSIVERATMPDLMTRPKQTMILAIGLVLSLLAGLAVGIVRSRTDPILRRPKDLERALGLSPYAVIPAMTSGT